MMKLNMIYLVFLSICYSFLKVTLAQEVFFDLEGGSQYEIVWLTRDEVTIATDTVRDEVLTEPLPNMLLMEGQWPEEAMRIKSADNEEYTCLLPSSILNENNEVESDEKAAELSPEYLLRPLQHQCTRLLTGYWNYELCHNNYLRQYHEEKLQDGTIKVDEYLLGENNDDITDTPTQDPSQDDTKIPVWPLHGRDYPYYPVKLRGGSSCDLKADTPRSVVIRYICDQEAFKHGSLLRVDEVTTCKYEAVVSTPHLCQNSHYRLQDNPIQSIKCFPHEDSPRRPKSLFEYEILSADFKDSNRKATPTEQPSVSEVKDGLSQSTSQKGKSVRRAGNSKAFELDKGFISSFLNGEMCLRGGAGWWLHEVCYGQHVKQLHMEQSGDSTEVVLGLWDEQTHREWFKKTGHRKLSKSQVVHLYSGGDLCKVTKTPRQSQVKFKCIKTAKLSQISLYLEEPATCSYTLTVEGGFVCTLLEHLDEHGVFNKASFEAANDKTMSQDKGVPDGKETDDVIENPNVQKDDEFMVTGNEVDNSIQEETTRDSISQNERSRTQAESKDREKGQRN